MKKLLLSVGVITVIGVVCVGVVAFRDGALTHHQLEGLIGKGFAVLTGLALAMAAALPLSFRGQRVKRVRGFVTRGPLTRTERHGNWRWWQVSAAILVAEMVVVCWWLLFNGGDPVVATWATNALGVGYLLGILVNGPAELAPLKPRMSGGDILRATRD